MAPHKIEPDLIKKAKGEPYQTRLLESIQSGQTLYQKTQDLKALDREPSQEDVKTAVEEITARLTATRDTLASDPSTIQSTVEVYRQTTDERQWPSVIVDILAAEQLEAVSSRLAQAGFSLVSDDIDTGRPSWQKYAPLRFLHVRIPPEMAFIDYLADQPFTDFVFDAEKIVTLPDPVIGRMDKGPALEMSEARDLILPAHDWPADAPASLGQDVNIAIVDSGIDSRHPDFMGKIKAIQNFTEEPDAEDTNGHGSHVAGIAAGRGAASHGRYQGISPESGLIIAKVFDASGSAQTSKILSAMQWAYEQRAQVMNLSLGNSMTPTDGQSLLSRACDRLAELGMVVCVSAGNSGPGEGTITTPGDAARAICVGAVDKHKALAYFSSRGPTDMPHLTGDKPDIVAPGVDIIAARASQSTLPPVDHLPEYAMLSGTSMSAPMITGVCALIISYGYFLEMPTTPEIIRTLLAGNAEPLDYTHHEQGRGFARGGRVLQAMRQQHMSTEETRRSKDRQMEWIGRYNVLECIGEGGFGKVYKVFDPDLDVTLAAKVSNTHGMSMEKDLAEARKQKKLNHRGVIRVDNIAKLENGQCAIIMEYAGGGSLRQRLDTGPLPLDQCLMIVDSLADALEQAHAIGLLHHDIKPENLLFDDKGNIKLTDFGIARYMEKTGHQMSAVIGTVGYMSPEQLDGKENRQSDIWSLGAVFYEMLTGQVCFKGKTKTETIGNIIKGKYLPPGQLNPSIPHQIADIVEKMLHVDTKKRFKSMAGVKSAIRDFRASGEKPRPRRSSTPKILFLAMVVAFVFTIAGGYYAYRQGWVQIRNPFGDTVKNATALPSEILNLPFSEMFDRAKTEIRDGNYELANGIFAHIASASSKPSIRDKAAFQKVTLLADFMDSPDMAIAEANAFVDRFPDSPYAGDFHYLLGHLYFDKRADLLKALHHLSIVQSKYPDSKRIQTVDFLVEKARTRLAEEGADIGLVSTNAWGSILPNNWLSLFILLAGSAATLIGVLARIFLGRQELAVPENSPLLNRISAYVWNRGVLLNILLMFVSFLVSWMINRYQSNEMYRKLAELIRHMSI